MFQAMIMSLALLQQPDSISEATVSPVFADGRLRGCAITFLSVRRDNLYFSGRAVGADGSLNLYHFGSGQLAAMLKVTVVDDRRLTRPDRVYLLTGLATNAEDLASSVPAEDAGYQLSMFSFGEATFRALEGLLSDGFLTIGVEMFDGQSAIPFRIDLTQEQMLDHTACTREIFTDARDALAED